MRTIAYICLGAVIGGIWLILICLELGCCPLARGWNPTLFTWGICVSVVVAVALPLEYDTHTSFMRMIATILRFMTGFMAPFLLQAFLAASS